MRFEEIYQQRTAKKLTIEEAAELLGVHERTFRRWAKRYEVQGGEGLADKRMERAAHNMAGVDEVAELLELFETHYSHFNVSHFYDKWREQHQGTRCYTWVKNRLQEAGLIKKAKRRGAHRRKRERRPLPGMMLHQDGSTHRWIKDSQWDLIVTLDDATNEIYSAFFVEEEGTWSSFQGVKEVILQHGLFCSLYTDRGSHYWSTPKAGEAVDKEQLTQFGRAMKHLGIEMIPAYSPEARGRSERAFGTLQGRLPNELALAGIEEMSAANRFLKESFLPAYNERFSVPAIEKGNAFVPWLSSNSNLDEILCLEEQRVVAKDNTVKYYNKTLQIPKDNHRCHYVKANVKIHEYADQSVAIFHGPRCLARYDAAGELQINSLADNVATKQQGVCG